MNIKIFTIITALIVLGCAKKTTSSQQDGSFGGKNPLIRIDGEIVSKEILNTIDKSDIDKIDVYKGESAITKFGEQANDGAIDIYTKTYKENKKKVLYNKLQDYLKEATGSENDFLFVLDGILIDESNIEQLMELDYAEIEIVEQITSAAAKTIYGEKAKPNTILVTTVSN